MRHGRGLLPPARRDTVGERALARLETILGLAVLQDVDVSRLGVGEPEPPGRIVLVVPGLQQQRIVAVAAETHVGEPWPAAVGRAHDERQMVERRAQAGLPVHPGGDPAHPRAERLEQQREYPVELIAEAAAATAHDLVDQVALIERDRLGQVDAQVLERHRHLVRTVQRAQARRVTGRRCADAHTVQVGRHGFVIHRHPPEGLDRPSRRFRRGNKRTPITLATSVPNHTTWMPRSCSSSDMAGTSTPYPRGPGPADGRRGS
jgi:hypothetical protein